MMLGFFFPGAKMTITGSSAGDHQVAADASAADAATATAAAAADQSTAPEGPEPVPAESAATP
jgi:hypothetical protein